MSQLIARNTDAKTAADIHDNFFLTAEDDLPAATCSVDYRIFGVDATHFGAVINVTNNTNQTIFDWTLRYQYYQGQTLQLVSGAIFTQSGSANNGRDVTATAVGGNEVIQPHTSEDIAVIRASFDGQLNAIPPNFTLNGHRCASNHH
jgi:endoglucanase